MSQPIMPTGTCSECRARWSWAGNQWIVADKWGRGSMVAGKLDKESGEPIPLPCCPECGEKLTPKGKARVKEVKP